MTDRQRMRERLIERLLRLSYQDEDGCWIYLGQVSKTSGYGKINIYDRKRKRKITHSVHRVAYEVFYDMPIPDGHTIDHDCEKKLCIHPNCLQAMTQLDNNRKWLDRRRGWPFARPFNVRDRKVLPEAA